MFRASTMHLKKRFFSMRTVKHGFMGQFTEMYITNIPHTDSIQLKALKILTNQFLQLQKKLYWTVSLKTSAAIAERR